MSRRAASEYTGYLFRRAQQAHVAAWQDEVSSEITSVQFGVLNTLAQEPGASQSDLCNRLDLDPSTIADIVARLERRELLTKKRHSSDKRRNVLHLTERGQRERDALVPLVSHMDARLTSGLSADECSLLRELLIRLLDAPAIHGLTIDS